MKTEKEAHAICLEKLGISEDQLGKDVPYSTKIDNEYARCLWDEVTKE